MHYVKDLFSLPSLKKSANPSLSAELQSGRCSSTPTIYSDDIQLIHQTKTDVHFHKAPFLQSQDLKQGNI